LNGRKGLAEKGCKKASCFQKGRSSCAHMREEDSFICVERKGEEMVLDPERREWGIGLIQIGFQGEIKALGGKEAC